MRVRWIAVVAFVLAACVGQRVAAAPEFEQRVFAVVINGEPVSSGSVVLQAGDGSILVAGDDLKRWRVKLDARVPRTALDGRAYFSLRDFPGVTARVDESRQILDLRVPAGLFEPTTLGFGRPGERRFDRSPGAFMNYWFSDTHFAGTAFEQGIFELGASGARGGVLTSTVGWRPSSFGAGWQRLNTTWERDFAEARKTLRIGDGISSPGRLGGTVSFGGIQVASDFAVDQEFQVSPALAIRGVTPSSSLVDVLVNNVPAVNAQPVPAGPFLLNTPPLGIDGQGQVRVIVRDALGAEHVVVEPFYQSRYLLRPGVDEYSYEAGFMRGAGSALSSYGKPMASGTLRHGVTDNFTAEGHLEATSGLALGELTADVTFPRFGLVSAGLATSFTPAGTGLRALLGYEFRAFNGMALAANVTAASPQFKTIGFDARASGVTEQFAVTLPVRTLAASFGFLATHPTQGPAVSYATVGLSGRLGSGTLNLSTTQGLSGTPAAYFFTYITHIGRNTLSTRTSNSAGIGRTSMDYATALPPSGLGSAVDLSLNRDSGGQPFVGGSYLLEAAPLHFDTFIDRDLVLSNLRGAFALVGGKAFATRDIPTSYGLAIVPGYPNVRVYVNGLEAGRTDKDGKVALPFLVPYAVNRISLDQRDLPISANIDHFEETLVPYFRSAAIVRFATGRAGGVIVRLRLADGSALPAGSLVMSRDGSQTYPVGDDGLTYLSAVAEGTSAYKAVVGGDGKCEFTVDVPHDASAIPDLGSVVCVTMPPSAASASPSPTGTPAPPMMPPPTAAPASPAATTAPSPAATTAPR
ncbi:MAG: fimbrial biogenesis outer membrane usher protein [Candidatus Eremiobacteraeota bacterium]|nr:fimbrial biogenesis outer membrane usher protein [Candidatus Eremiobacteraeota bacterium]